MNKLYGFYHHNGNEFWPYVASALDWPTAYAIAKFLLEHEPKYEKVAIKTDTDRIDYVTRETKPTSN